MTIEGESKVFCIGWHKTGTSSLGSALVELGYSVVGARLDLEDCLRDGDCSEAIRIAGEYDAVQDVPWAALYRELDREFPGARFILTDREDSAWIKSAVGHFGARNISMHEWLYGNGRCEGNEDLYLDKFRRHRTEVRAWFATRPSLFLEMNFEQGDGWTELCSFLDCPVPNKRWPHANKGKHSLTRLEIWLNSMRGLTPMRLRKAVFGVRQKFRKRMGLSDPTDIFNNREQNRARRRKH